MAATAALATIPDTADACTPPPSLAVFPELVVDARTDVPTDGVIAFQAQTFGELDEALGLVSIEVTQGDAAIAGAIETIVLSESDAIGTPVAQIFVVWRPEMPLQPSTEYLASISVADPYVDTADPIVTTIAVSTGEGPAGSLPALTLSGVELSAEASATGPRVCCDVENSCGFDSCSTEELLDLPVLRATVDIAEDPMAAQSYVRLSSGVGEALDVDGIAGIAADLGGTTFQRTFDGAGDEYCFGAELVSLIDGSVQPIVSQCLPHGDLELTTSDNDGFDAFLDECIGDPYWEETGEPYVPDPDGGDSDGGDADGGDADGGDADGGDADGGNLDGGDDGDGGLDDDEGGCACNVDAPRSGWPAFAMFVAVGAWLRRRARR